jgi:hypothetical protein
MAIFGWSTGKMAQHYTRAAEALSLAAYIGELCSAGFRGARAHEQPFLSEYTSAMTQMLVEMQIKPSGDVDPDFAALMIPHRQGRSKLHASSSSLGKVCPVGT